MPKIERNCAVKRKDTRRVYALIQARDFERAHEELRAREVDIGRDGDYYKCCAVLRLQRYKRTMIARLSSMKSPFMSVVQERNAFLCMRM